MKAAFPFPALSRVALARAESPIPANVRNKKNETAQAVLGRIGVGFGSGTWSGSILVETQSQLGSTVKLKRLDATAGFLSNGDQHWAVVQLAARLTLNQKVPGSSPGGPIIKP